MNMCTCMTKREFALRLLRFLIRDIPDGILANSVAK